MLRVRAGPFRGGIWKNRSIASAELAMAPIAYRLVREERYSRFSMEAVEHIFQIVSIIAGTFILEDATALSVGVLILDRALEPWVGFMGLLVGIVVGDILLFFGGRIRCARRFLLRRIPRSKISKARRLFKRHVVEALIVARFTPGMRAPTFFAAGLFNVSLTIFILTVVVLSLLWISFLGMVLYWLGKSGAERLLGWWGVPLIILCIVAVTIYLKMRKS